MTKNLPTSYQRVADRLLSGRKICTTLEADQQATSKESLPKESLPKESLPNNQGLN
jgi:hypothetical protein